MHDFLRLITGSAVMTAELLIDIHMGGREEWGKVHPVTCPIGVFLCPISIHGFSGSSHLWDKVASEVDIWPETKLRTWGIGECDSLVSVAGDRKGGLHFLEVKRVEAVTKLR